MEHLTRDTEFFRPKLKIHMRGGLQWVAHDQERYKTRFRKSEQRIRLLNLRAHDTLDGTDLVFQVR
jgi:type 1 glutamine amidotransferase